jgi:3-deoxy-D-manno-octulosonic acid kinase
LSAILGRGGISAALWQAVGSTVARLHRAGVDHADLNAHNILLDGKGAVSVIDFDRGRLRAPGAWTSRNLRRLQRSLDKISRAMPSGRYSAADWQSFMAGYGAG